MRNAAVTMDFNHQNYTQYISHSQEIGNAIMWERKEGFLHDFIPAIL